MITVIIIGFLLCFATIWFRLKRQTSLFVMALIALVLFIDQALKFWVKTNMEYEQEIPLFGHDWAYLRFVENPGMAFGMELGGEYGKLALSLFRIFAVIFLIYFIIRLIKLNLSMGFLASFALILAGALGNIIDSAFYGLIFSDSPAYHGGLATLFPPEGGYAGFLHGKVVDMLYFPMFKGIYPDWFPIMGGKPYLFFRPIFNIADSAITVGVISIIVFYRSFFAAVDKQTSTDIHPKVTTSDVTNLTPSDNKGSDTTSDQN